MVFSIPVYFKNIFFIIIYHAHFGKYEILGRVLQIHFSFALFWIIWTRLSDDLWVSIFLFSFKISVYMVIRMSFCIYRRIMIVIVIYFIISIQFLLLFEFIVTKMNFEQNFFQVKIFSHSLYSIIEYFLGFKSILTLNSKHFALLHYE